MFELFLSSLLLPLGSLWGSFGNLWGPFGVPLGVGGIPNAKLGAHLLGSLGAPENTIFRIPKEPNKNSSKLPPSALWGPCIYVCFHCCACLLTYRCFLHTPNIPKVKVHMRRCPKYKMICNMCMPGFRYN
jgi:hypothetical protein